QTGVTGPSRAAVALTPREKGASRRDRGGRVKRWVKAGQAGVSAPAGWAGEKAKKECYDADQ
ncbi:MAG TPA: hypothetical protein VHQ67_00500, partial [Nitrospiraceae bacterium]|nr:hypothetical protein [Nitrospiraceae bacterium]